MKNDIKKIEIIISDSHLPMLLEHFEELQVNGYTALPISRGKGIKHGEQLSEGLLPTTRKSLIFTVAKEPHANRIITRLSPFLEEIGGLIVAINVNFATGISNQKEPR